MQKLTTEAQRTQSFPWEMFLCDLCASVVRNLHDETRNLFQTHSFASSRRCVSLFFLTAMALLVRALPKTADRRKLRSLSRLRMTGRAGADVR